MGKGSGVSSWCKTQLCHTSITGWVDIRYIQGIPGHKSSNTAGICTRVGNRGICRVRSLQGSLNINREGKL